MASFSIALALLGLAAAASGASVAAPGSSPNPAVWPMPAVGRGDDADVAPYIIGGEDAAVAEFPYQLSMQVSMLWLIKQHICGASLLSERWALTAAHCVKGVPFYASAFVLAGKVDLGAKEQGQQKAVVRRMFAHEKYAGGVGPYDVGLLHLKTALVLSDTVKPIALPAVAKAVPSGDAVLSGWGYVDAYSQVTPKHLQKVTLPIVSADECRTWVDTLLSGTGSANPLVESNICLGHEQEAGQGVCNGDSGGPMVQTVDGQLTLLGVASWTFTPCQAQAAPSVYTSVAYYLDWIEETQENNP